LENPIENLPPPEKKNTARRNADSYFVTWERRTALVKQQVTAESTANDTKTARLRALRLAKEAAEKEAAPAKAPKRAAAKRKHVIKA
jgi:hypothetical protein